MTKQVQDEDEIIILSDDNDFSNGLEIDEQNEIKANVSQINNIDDDMFSELSLDNEIKDNENIKQDISANIKESSKAIKGNEEIVENGISFDLGLEEDTKHKPKKSSSYDLNSIIDGTISDLKIRKEELISDKNDNISEKEFRDSEIKRLKDEIHTLNVDKSKLESEIKKIDENIIGLGKMKIGTHVTKRITKK